MKISDARFTEFAIPLDAESEISNAFWKTDRSVTEIAQDFGLSGSGKVNSAVCKARLNGIVCSVCNEEMIARTRTEAIEIVKDYRGGPWSLKNIKCDPCYRAERAKQWAPKRRIETTERKPKEALPAPPKDEKAEFYLSWDWRTLRMKVLQQYGARCMCCGSTPEHKTVGGEPVAIVVDHIKPLSKYWDLRLERGNLQVLCQECNQGKGAWDETDYRPVPKTDEGDTVQ
ncbi:HNH endonuclease [Rhizobium leguminosarum]|nr:HNH endonuclease [Rhizobium leguminosarum]